ncbi:unnamed protein product [Ectocarpus sp. CCAP 1310/34]|nr:unnamed protein product [Ectocarpus sp. CCAP 1310/34]
MQQGTGLVTDCDVGTWGVLVWEVVLVAFYLRAGHLAFCL